MDTCSSGCLGFSIPQGLFLLLWTPIAAMERPTRMLLSCSCLNSAGFSSPFGRPKMLWTDLRGLGPGPWPLRGLKVSQGVATHSALEDQRPHAFVEQVGRSRCKDVYGTHPPSKGHQCLVQVAGPGLSRKQDKGLWPFLEVLVGVATPIAIWPGWIGLLGEQLGIWSSWG